MLDIIKYIAIYGVLMAVLWTGGTFFASTVADYEVIEPEGGIHCVVVSRMFNTSVDCYKL